MPYIVQKPLKVDRGGTLVRLMPGDPCPEAETWKNTYRYVSTGFIAWEGDGSEPVRLPKASQAAKRKGKLGRKASPAQLKALERGRIARAEKKAAASKAEPPFEPPTPETTDEDRENSE